MNSWVSLLVTRKEVLAEAEFLAAERANHEGLAAGVATLATLVIGSVLSRFRPSQSLSWEQVDEQ